MPGRGRGVVRSPAAGPEPVGIRKWASEYRRTASVAERIVMTVDELVILTEDLAAKTGCTIKEAAVSLEIFRRLSQTKK